MKLVQVVVKHSAVFKISIKIGYVIFAFYKKQEYRYQSINQAINYSINEFEFFIRTSTLKKAFKCS